MNVLAAEVLSTAQAMNASGINRGAAGNVSARDDEGFLITPTGMAYDECVPEDIVKLNMDGTPAKVGVGGTAVKQRWPSSEWRFHRDIYASRAEAGAIIHCHSPFATSLSCHQLEIPPFHYMIARFGGETVRCADYATFGTQELSDAMLVALEGRRACLMAHHGMVVFGANLKEALALAIELETLCEQYWRVLQIGQPKLLAPDEMHRVIEKFKSYGRQS